jgi:hypothetical protein
MNLHKCQIFMKIYVAVKGKREGKATPVTGRECP